MIDTEKYTRLKELITVFNSHIKCNENVWRPRKNELHYIEFVDGNGYVKSRQFKTPSLR